MDVLGIFALFGVTCLPLINWVSDNYITEWDYGIWIGSVVTLLICLSVVPPYWTDEDTWIYEETIPVTEIGNIPIAVPEGAQILKSIYSVPWCMMPREKYKVHLYKEDKNE